MSMLIAAAAIAAAQPATPATPAPTSQSPKHEMNMQMGQEGHHQGMDCCKECCDHMAAMHEGAKSEHPGHDAH